MAMTVAMDYVLGKLTVPVAHLDVALHAYVSPIYMV